MKEVPPVGVNLKLSGMAHRHLSMIKAMVGGTIQAIARRLLEKGIEAEYDRLLQEQSKIGRKEGK